MDELLPVIFGVAAAAVVLHTEVLKPKVFWFILASVVGGALASWLNGELAHSFWALFVSLDAALAWLGALGYAAARHAYGRLRQA